MKGYARPEVAPASTGALLRVLLAAASLILLLAVPLMAQPTDSVSIVFLDVGQGDAVLVRSPAGKAALIDAGPDDRIVTRLRRLGVDTLDLLLASHAHADHIGGMGAVLREFPVRHFMDNGRPHTTATYRELMQTLRRSEITYLEARSRRLDLGGVELTVLPPPADAADQNNASVGLLITYGDFHALLTGDAEAEALAHFIALGVPDVTLLKAAHHGSRDGLTPRWLTVTRPELVVISCGRDNPYGHPHAWALRYYGAAGAQIYRTDLDGDVRVRAAADGEYVVTTQRARAGPAPIEAVGEAPTPDRKITLAVHADAPGNDHHNLNGEYVILGNRDSTALSVAGWRLCDAAAHCYTFPGGATIPAGASVRVFTGPGGDGDGRFYIGSARAIWNNGGDVATLWNERGEVVARHAY